MNKEVAGNLLTALLEEGVLCFIGQKSSKSNVQVFLGSLLI